MSARADRRPPRVVHAIGRAASNAVARFPRLWPVLRAPTRRFFDRAAPVWDTRFATGGEQRMQPLAAACELIETPPARILDLGTGTGAAALWLATRFPEAEVVGVDLSDAMIAAARQKTPPDLARRVRFEVGDASRLPYESGHFDLVAQMSMLVFFDEIARVLAPGGHVLVTASIGPDTPYFTPDSVLRRELGRRDLREVARGDAGAGSWFLARAS